MRTIALLIVALFGIAVRQGDWSVDKQKSPIDDTTTVTVSRRAETEISGWPDKKATPVLVLRHQEGRIEAYIVTGFAAHVDGGQDLGDAKCTVRFDKEKASETSLHQSTSNDSLFFYYSRSWIRSLVAHEQLVFRFTPFNSSPQTTTFDLRGLRESLAQFEDSSNWRIGSCRDLLDASLVPSAGVPRLLGFSPDSDLQGLDLAMHLKKEALVGSPEMRAVAIGSVLSCFSTALSESKVEGMLPAEWGILASINPGAIPKGTLEELKESIRKEAEKDGVSPHLSIRTDESLKYPVRVEFTGIPSERPSNKK